MNTSPKRRRTENLHDFAILTALAAGTHSGSEIQAQIIGDTGGEYVTVSSLYTALHRLEEVGLVESRNKYYELTAKGWHQLQFRARTLNSLVEQAKSRIIQSGHGRW